LLNGDGPVVCVRGEPVDGGVWADGDECVSPDPNGAGFLEVELSYPPIFQWLCGRFFLVMSPSLPSAKTFVPLKRAYYAGSIENFLSSSKDTLLGELVLNNTFALEQTQRNAWMEEITLLQKVLLPYPHGTIYFEYSIPRMGERIDVLLLVCSVVFVLEFKVGEKEFTSSAVDQVFDYALDLKNFHETSHACFVAPILIATEANNAQPVVCLTLQNDRTLVPIRTNPLFLAQVLADVLAFSDGEVIERTKWECGRYCPTPTIMEAAMALYNGHTVHEISRSDASAINLSQTSEAVSDIIRVSKEKSRKSICFVTGVPGAGKTLVGLNIATKSMDKGNDLHSVYLSGNGPLVAILREALTRDRVRRSKTGGERVRKGKTMSAVKVFIQNVHHFRDQCLIDLSPPFEHVALFDEAQRAWDRQQTTNFMARKKKQPGFNQSEPEFLISCLDRHSDWGVVVCLVGGGQEINTGEAGISEWIESVLRKFPHWCVYVSPQLTDSEYGAGDVMKRLQAHRQVIYKDELHLSVSLRSFRSENVAQLIKNVLDLNLDGAKKIIKKVTSNYPIVITRDLATAKNWLKTHARGSERYGIVVSSQAERLKPHAIDVKSPMDPIHWFLDGKEDVRSSYYLEDVATEFHVQGLELDWACVAWDADFRYSPVGWEHRSFSGSRWNYIRKEERQRYQKNAYRVLLTRARQGMVIVVPSGDLEDLTRQPTFYNPTFEYLKEVGFEVI